MTGKLKPPVLAIEYGTDIFVLIDGVKIAKRGHPGTPQAKTWVSLEPGWRVFDGPKGGLRVRVRRRRRADPLIPAQLNGGGPHPQGDTTRSMWPAHASSASRISSL